MSMMKRYLEDLSVKLGYDGEITDEVLAAATVEDEVSVEAVEPTLIVANVPAE